MLPDARWDGYTQTHCLGLCQNPWLVDLGNGANDDDSAPVAKDACVFMVVHVNGQWKVTCGYFLIDSLQGKVARKSFGNMLLNGKSSRKRKDYVSETSQSGSTNLQFQCC